MDINVLIICITVVICLFLLCATALTLAEKAKEVTRPRSFAEMLGGYRGNDEWE